MNKQRGKKPREFSEEALSRMDADDPNDRPVIFDFRTGKRLKPSNTKSLRHYDIQKDDHYCPWCGTVNARHYDSYSRWIPCRVIVEH